MSVILKNKKKEPEKLDYQFFYFEGQYLNFNNIVSIKKHPDYENLMEITYAHPQLDSVYQYDGSRSYKTKYETFTMGKNRFKEYLKPYLDSKTLKISK